MYLFSPTNVIYSFLCRLRTIDTHTLTIYVLLLIHFCICERLSHLLNILLTSLLLHWGAVVLVSYGPVPLLRWLGLDTERIIVNFS